MFVETQAAPTDEEELEEILSRPTPALIEDFARLDGDILICGVGGKMGPTLARMARRALDAAGRSGQQVIAVARFSNPNVRSALESCGVHILVADLAVRAQVNDLPDTANLIFMAGQKFGTRDAPEATWLMNGYVPGMVAERFAPGRPRTVVFSTGCVYANVRVDSGGSVETDALEPLGEYANSCVARERLFGTFARKHEMPTVFFRLNYAIDLRYGVLVDVAHKVLTGEAIDLTMGYANVIWQGDANAIALRSLLHADVPPLALNVTGPERVSIREVAQTFGERFGRAPLLTGQEAYTALLSNASVAHARFGPPTVPLDSLIDMVAAWQLQGGRLLGKPTHYETRDGKY